MEAAKIVQPLIESKCKNSEYSRNIWCVVPEINVSVEHVLKPQYWANVAHTMRITDRIEVNAEDNSWFAELMVMDVGTLWVKAELMRKVEFAKHEVTSGAQEEYVAKWNAGGKCFRVIRKADNAVVQDDIKSKGEANLWIANHTRDMAA